jgi:hypothetical protein
MKLHIDPNSPYVLRDEENEPVARAYDMGMAALIVNRFNASFETEEETIG